MLRAALLCACLVLFGCDRKLDIRTEKSEIPNITLDTKKNVALEELWQKIFTDKYVSSPYQPAENNLLIAKEIHTDQDLLLRTAKERQLKLEDEWKKIPKVNSQKYLILQYIFQEHKLEEITHKINEPENRFDLGRLLVSECLFEKGYEILDTLYESIEDNNPLKSKIRKQFIAYGFHESLLTYRGINKIPLKYIENIEHHFESTEHPIEEVPDVVETIRDDYVVVKDEKGELNGKYPPEGISVQAIIKNTTILEDNAGRYWSEKNQNKLTLTSIYKGKVTFNLYQVYRDEIFKTFGKRDLLSSELIKSWTQENKPLSENNNGVSQQEIEVPSLKKGKYILTARMKFCPALIVKRIVVSDNLLYLRQFANKVDIIQLGTDLKPKKSSVYMTEFSDNKQIRTRIQLDREGSQKVNFDKDTYRTLIEDGLENSAAFNNKSFRQTSGEITTLWTSRPLYKRGDMVSYRGAIRTIDFNRTKVTDRKDVLVIISDPYGRRYHSEMLKISPTGSFFGQVKMKENAKKGTYQIKVLDRTIEFKVSEFRLPKFAMSFEDMPKFLKEDKFTAKVKLTSINGSPLFNSRIKFTIDGKESIVRTDRNGYASIKVNTNKAESFYPVFAQFRSPDGELITIKHEITVSSKPFKLSLEKAKKVSKYEIVGKLLSRKEEFEPEKVRWTLFDKDGKRKLEHTESLTLSLPVDHTYTKVLCQCIYNGFLSESTHHFSDQQIEVEKPYLKIFADEEVAIGSLPVHIHVDLKNEQSLFPVYLYIQNEKLWERKSLNLKRGKNIVNLDFKDEWGPNVFLHVVAFKDENNMLSDKCEVKLARKFRQIDLKVTTDKKLYNPGETVSVKIKAISPFGKFIENAEISLAVVDEALYHIQEEHPFNLNVFHDYKLKDFFQEIYNPGHRYSAATKWFIGPVLQYSDNIMEGHSVGMAQMASFFGGRTAAGRAAFLRKMGRAPKIRNAFKVEAFWAPMIKTDRQGNASVKFKVPDSITSWRMTARAISIDGLTAEKKSTFSSTIPIETDVVLPRIVRSGDILGIPVNVINRGDNKVSILEANTTSKGKVIASLPKTKVTINKDSLKTAFFKLRIPETEELKFNSIIRSRTYSDGVERSIPVTETGYRNEIYENLLIKTSTTLNLPKVVNDRLKLTVTLEQGIDQKIKSALDRLVGYSYGCAEQTISRFTPLIIVSKSLDEFGLENVHKEKMPKLIEDGLARLYRFQHKDGGWKWYANGRSDYRVSVLVLEGLLEAHSQGVDVRDDVIKRGAEYVQSCFFAKAESNAASQIGSGDATDFLAANVLSLYAKIFNETITKTTIELKIEALKKRLKHQMEYLSLSETLFNLGFKDKAKEIFSEAKKGKVTAGRSTAMTLGKYLSIIGHFHKGHPEKQINTLSMLKNNGWWYDTRATFFAIRGLAKHLELKEAESGLKYYINGKYAGKLTNVKNTIFLTDNALIGGKITFVNQARNPVSILVHSRYNSINKAKYLRPQVKLKSEILVDGQIVTAENSLSLQRKKFYTYRIHVDSSVDLNYCNLSIPRPAGIEINEKPQLRAGIVEFEEYNDSFNFFIESLPAGKYTLEMTIRADLPGKVFAPLPFLGKMYGDPLRVNAEAPEYWSIQ